MANVVCPPCLTFYIPNRRLQCSTFERNRSQLSRDTSRWRKTTRQSCGVPFASMRDAKELVQSGVVLAVSSKDASGLLSEGGYQLLDVRPVWEREKAFVTGSYHVPIFIEDLDTGALNLIRKGIQAGQGGWWTGLKLTAKNEEFVTQVRAVVPEGQKLMVVCGEGLRSLLALDELNNAGFEQLAWIIGGFNSVRDDHFPKVEGSTQLRFSTIGGASEYVLKFALFVQGVVNQIKEAQSVDR